MQENDPLDAYSRIVTHVAATVTHQVAAITMTGETAVGSAARGSGSAVLISDSGASSPTRTSSGGAGQGPVRRRLLDGIHGHRV